jgi:hypothetical protein
MQDKEKQRGLESHLQPLSFVDAVETQQGDSAAPTEYRLSLTESVTETIHREQTAAIDGVSSTVDVLFAMLRGIGGVAPQRFEDGYLHVTGTQ